MLIASKRRHGETCRRRNEVVVVETAKHRSGKGCTATTLVTLSETTNRVDQDESKWRCDSTTTAFIGSTGHSSLQLQRFMLKIGQEHVELN
jgi:hypothetical protein